MMTVRFLIGLLTILYAFQDCIAQQKRTSEKASATVDQIFTPEIGGIKQVIKVTTNDLTNPVLLFLSGGPGSSMMNNAESYTALLKTEFTLVQWDQRNAGKTLQMNPSPTQPSVAQMEKDTYEVVNFLIQELKQKKIYLLGSS